LPRQGTRTSFRQICTGILTAVKGSADVIKRIMGSLEELNHLPKGWDDGVHEAYGVALWGVFLVGLGVSGLGLLFASLLREHKLYNTGSREDDLPLRHGSVLRLAGAKEHAQTRRFGWVGKKASQDKFSAYFSIEKYIACGREWSLIDHADCHVPEKECYRE